jgi:hypothetical protein
MAGKLASPLPKISLKVRWRFPVEMDNEAWRKGSSLLLDAKIEKLV